MDLPGAQTRLDTTANAAAVATKLLCVIAAVPLHADAMPRLWGNAGDLQAFHGYAEGVDFSAMYISEDSLPVLFVPLPIATPGVVGRFNQSGNTDTSDVTVAVGPYGSLDEVDGQVRVNRGGTVGTDQIIIDLSLDGGMSWKTGIKIGTALSYTIPYIGQIVSFAAGDLTDGDVVLTWHSTAPLWDTTGLTAGKTALEAQYKQMRTWQVIGDLSTKTQVGYVVTAVNAYETEVERYTLAKVALRDRTPSASMAQARVRMAGAPTVTFTEVGAGGDYLERTSGSFVTDGFVDGDTIRVTGAVAGGGHNNVTGVGTIAGGTPTRITFADASVDLDNEGPIDGVAITAEMTLTFTDGGAGVDTISRNQGSWLNDGFRVGDVVSFDGTASNDAVTGTITVLTATLMTFATGTLAGSEVIGSYGVTVSAGETDAEHVSALEAEMFTVADEERVDLGIGRGRKLSPFLGFEMRRPVQWADTIQAYAHDVHVATWAPKKAGPCSGWSLEDADGNIVEHDEFRAKNALAAGFTCFRTWPDRQGTFIARSVTRAEPGTPLSATENMCVANLAQTIAQSATTDALGDDLILNTDGTATPESLAAIKHRVDVKLGDELLTEKVAGEKQRASSAAWTPNQGEDLSGVDASLTGVLDLTLNGKLVHINTKVRVNAGS